MQQPPLTKGDRLAARQAKRDLKHAKRVARQMIRSDHHMAGRLADKLGSLKVEQKRATARQERDE